MDYKAFEYLCTAMEKRIIAAMNDKFISWKEFKPYQYAIATMLALLLGLNGLQMAGVKVNIPHMMSSQSSIQEK
jgi:hypothetical protein